MSRLVSRFPCNSTHTTLIDTRLDAPCAALPRPPELGRTTTRATRAIAPAVSTRWGRILTRLREFSGYPPSSSSYLHERKSRTRLLGEATCQKCTAVSRPRLGHFPTASGDYWTQRTKTVQGPVWEPWYTTLQPLAFVEPFAGRFVPLPEIANEESS